MNYMPVTYEKIMLAAKGIEYKDPTNPYTKDLK